MSVTSYTPTTTLLTATLTLLMATAMLPVHGIAAPTVCGDVINDDGLKATDALAVLKAAVGLGQELECPRSVAAVLHFDAQWSPTNLPGNMGNSIVTPDNCKTGTWVAGPNEVAVMSVAGTASPSAVQNNIVFIEPTTSKNGGSFETRLVSVAAASLSVGTAHVSTSVTFPLDEGASYRFGAGFASNSAVTINTGFCQGTIEILRPEQ